MRVYTSIHSDDFVLDLNEHAENGVIALVDAVACVRRHPEIISGEHTPLDVLKAFELSGTLTVNTKEGIVLVS
jgi:hypothetical protein